MKRLFISLLCLSGICLIFYLLFVILYHKDLRELISRKFTELFTTESEL